MSREASINAFHSAIFERENEEGFVLSGWSSRDSQIRRFEALIRTSGFNEGTVVDYGCGSGDLFGFLQRLGVKFQYRGYDQDARMVEIASKRYGPHFHHIQLDAVDFEVADYVFASGIFQFVDTALPDYYVKLSKLLFSRSTRALSMNFLSAKRREDQKHARELYLCPGDVLDIAERMTGFWMIDHSYHLGLGDVTLSLHKEQENLSWSRPQF